MKQIAYNIERIVQNKDDKYWAVEYEFWDLNKESDDDGIDGVANIYEDPQDFANALQWFLVNESCSPINMDFQIIFIPVDVKELLAQIEIIWAGTYYGELSASKNKIEWGFDAGSGEINATISYTDNGVLEKMEIKFKGDTAYILDLTSSGMAVISSGLYFIPIFAISILGVIYTIKNKLKFKS